MTTDLTSRVLLVALLVFVIAVLAAGAYAGGQLGDGLSQIVTVTR